MRFSRLLCGVMGILFVLALIRLPARAADEPRNFIIVFETHTYSGDMDDAVRYIFNDLLRSGDQLIVYTPGRVYGFSKATLAKPKDMLTALLQEKLRGDTTRGAIGYLQIVKDMKTAAQVIENNALGNSSSPQESEVELKNNLTVYRQLIANLVQLRRINEPFIKQILGVFRNQTGRNHLIVICENELRPIPSKQAMDILREDAKISFQVQELFAQTSTKPPFDPAAIAALCSEVGATAHFLYFRPKTEESLGRDTFDNSGDMYDALSKVVEATHGVRLAIGEIKAGLKTIVGVLKGDVSTTYTTQPQ